MVGAIGDCNMESYCAVYGLMLLDEQPRRMDPQMVFSPDLTKLYVSVPKTGCSSIKTIMAASFGLVEPEVLGRQKSGDIHNLLVGRAVKWSDLGERGREEMLSSESVFRFTSVRNPYERLVSFYLDKMVKGRPKYHLRERLIQQGPITILSLLKYVIAQQ